ncbi:hypothetical protein F3Y22_tig00110560pilonHSYRG00053 [Hibiscus syriacus]|uniref:U-box domain-containing protein n=1 Tax=Hibiscus syriacus TaxID=106335 RepID=A0A6A3A718_HIBSY|nr:U-box domain-containing protein 12-like [Hibiscus syriacus]KAE8700164.1 hypothetical protein F3Y22_tig00110560pilonHSYRG00053 [Hibiscus syriacus]
MSTVKLRETILECLFEAQSGSEELRLEALQTLASITRVSPQNRTLVAQSNGAIPALLTLCKSSSPLIQTLSLSILFNLSLNPNLKQSLADMKTINHLNSIFSSTSPPESTKLASSLICSLAMLDKNKAMFGVAGTIPLLVHAVSDPCNPAAHYLLSSLAELVQFHGNCTLAVRAGAVPVLIQVVKSTDGEDLSGTSLAVLELVSRFDEGLNALKKTDHIVSSMVEVMKRRSMMSKEGAAEILVRLFEESEACIVDALKLPDFLTVLADISVRGSARARDKAALLLKKTTEANLDSYSTDASHMLF